jgi:stage IV sporulation protein FB
MAVSASGFKVAGIPVHIRPTFFVIIVLLGLSAYPVMPYPISWVVIATVSVLIHELGHAVCFRFFGLQPSISLHGMGGLTSAPVGDADAPPFTPVRSIVTSLAGPFAALLLLGVPSWLAARGLDFDPFSLARGMGGGEMYVQRSGIARGWIEATPLHVFVNQAIWINVGWSILNLIPVLPLDGGNVTASVFELFSPRNGRRVANVISIVLAGALGLWGLSSGYLFGALVAAGLIWVNVAELAGQRHDRTDDELTAATRALLDFEPARAEQLVRGVLGRNLDGDRRRAATELFAWSRLAQGDAGSASQVIAAMPPEAGPTATIRAATALGLGNSTEGVTTMAWALAHDPDRSAKALGAIAVAQSGQVDAVTRELLLLGPAGREGGEALRDGLARTGHTVEARRVGQLLATGLPD